MKENRIISCYSWTNIYLKQSSGLLSFSRIFCMCGLLSQMVYFGEWYCSKFNESRQVKDSGVCIFLLSCPIHSIVHCGAVPCHSERLCCFIFALTLFLDTLCAYNSARTIQSQVLSSNCLLWNYENVKQISVILFALCFRLGFPASQQLTSWKRWTMVIHKKTSSYYY